jgi:hypothetical protein
MFLHFSAVLLVVCATTKASVSNHTHAKLGIPVTINSMNKIPSNGKSRSTIQEIPAYHKDRSFIIVFTTDQR